MENPEGLAAASQVKRDSKPRANSENFDEPGANESSPSLLDLKDAQYGTKERKMSFDGLKEEEKGDYFGTGS